MLVEQRLRSHQESGRAVAALRGAEVGEGLLQRVEPAVRHQAFDGEDVASIALDAEDQAGEDRLSIEQNRTGSAFSQLAAVLRAAEIEILTKDFEKRFVRSERHFYGFGVHGQREMDVGHGISDFGFQISDW